MTSSKSGKNSAWKRAVGAAGRPYSCRPVSPPSEPPSPRWRSRLPPQTRTVPARSPGVPPRHRGVPPHPAGSRRPPPRARPVGCSAAPDGFRTLDRGGAAVGARRLRVPSRPPAASRRAEGGVAPPVRPDLGLSRPFSLRYGSGIPRAAAAQPRGRPAGTGHGPAPLGAPPTQTHPPVPGNRGQRTPEQPRGCFNEYRAVGQPRPPSPAAPGAGDGVHSPPCPDGGTGCQRLGVALPGPGDKEAALQPEIQPSFVNCIPLLPPGAGPAARARDAPGGGCARAGRHRGDGDTPGPRGERARRAGAEPHTALAAILPSAANFARRLRAVPALLPRQESGTGRWERVRARPGLPQRPQVSGSP